MLKYIFICLTSILLTQLSIAQRKPLPIIDMHLHAMPVKKGSTPAIICAPFRVMGLTDPAKPYTEVYQNALQSGAWTNRQLIAPTNNDTLKMLTLRTLNKYNVYAVTSGDMETVRDWKKSNPDRIINALDWGLGLAKNQALTPDSLEKIFKKGEFKVFGEITIQYEGYSASDSAFEPYLAMAEKLDIPVGIHLGPGPPGAPYLNYENYRAKLHSPFGLEEALIRHPKLRMYAMHAGWPMLDEMIATMYTHPQLYVDLAAICYMIPTKEFYFYLERLINAGFGKRIMFGSDNMVWPQAIEIGIESINKAPFLSSTQKRDILFNNAARFLRLTDSEIKAMQ